MDNTNSNNHPKKLWFKAKSYGWGWTPCTWQGWLLIAVYIGYMVWSAYSLNQNQHSVSDFLMNFYFKIIISTGILLAICYAKGEKPGWRWGNKK